MAEDINPWRFKTIYYISISD